MLEIIQGPFHVPLGLPQIAAALLTSENTKKGKEKKKTHQLFVGSRDVKMQVYKLIP